jgi:hypothetical protein
MGYGFTSGALTLKPSDPCSVKVNFTSGEMDDGQMGMYGLRLCLRSDRG